MSAPVPPGWPAEVWPPQQVGWEDTAVAWLLDQAPSEWRLLPVLRRHPQVLAWLTVQHLQGQVQAARAAWTDLPTRRIELEAVYEVRQMLAEVGPELGRRLQAAVFLQAALDGLRYVPRL
jgi:hypothetical protein